MTHPRLLDLIGADDQPNLGASLLRLARLAEAAHRYEAAQSHRLESSGPDAIDSTGRPAPAHPAGKDAALTKLRCGGSSTHTEVRR